MSTSDVQPDPQEERRPRIQAKAPLDRSRYMGETVADEMMIQIAFQELRSVKGEQFVRKLVACLEKEIDTLDAELCRRYKRRASNLDLEEVRKGFAARISKYRRYLDQ